MTTTGTFHEDKIDDILGHMTTDVEYSDEHMDISMRFEPIKELSVLLADFFHENHGTNYVTWQVKDPRDNEQYVFMIQRQEGRVQQELVDIMRRALENIATNEDAYQAFYTANEALKECGYRD